MEELIRTVKQNKANKSKFVTIPQDSKIQPGDEVVIIPKNSEKDFLAKAIIQLTRSGYMSHVPTDEEFVKLLKKVKSK